LETVSDNSEKLMQNNYVEVFKTNIQSMEQFEMVRNLLSSYFQTAHITIDLEDCDNVLRIVSSHEISKPLIVETLINKGINCSILE